MKKISLIIILLITVYTIKAQEKFVIQTKIMSSPIIDSSKIDSYLNFVGVVRNLEINCLDNEFAQRKDKIWRKQIKIQSEGAKEIEVVFRKFILSPNAVISFNTDSLQYRYQGAYFVHKPDSSYISEFLYGDYCIIVIEIPIDEFEQNQIQISQIHHLTESFNNVVKSNDYSCMIDVNCQEGNNWCDQKRSIAIYYYTKKEERYYCTGALVNNYQNNFTQYFLTARHCVSKDIDNWATIKFYFNYQNTFCNSNDVGVPNRSGNSFYGVQGSQLVGYCDKSWSDNALLLITEPIPIQYNVYYAGVDITNRSLGDGVTCIHHSDELPKKITSGKIKFFAGPKWDVYWDNGIIMGGGSGSPIFLNSNKRVIATISGGMNYDCNSSMKHDWVGKVKACMSHSDGMRNALFGDTEISSYGGIDPAKVCQQNISLSGNFYSTHTYDATLDGLDIHASTKITVSNAAFHSDANFTLTAGNEIVFLPGTVIEHGSNVWVKAVSCASNSPSCVTHSKVYKNINNDTQINSEDNDIEYFQYSNPITEDASIDKITLYPNPNSGSFTIGINDISEIQQIQVFSPIGQMVYSVQNPDNNMINLPSTAKGTFFVKIITQTETVIKKIIVE